MKLFGWFRNDPVSKGLVPGRAVAIPHYPRVEVRMSAVENNSSADSISTLSITLRLLQPGETADSVGSKYERLPANTAHATTDVPPGCQRLHCNCPNWVHLMVRQEGHVYRENAEIPVWVNPLTGKIDRIDKDKLVEELLFERDRAHRIWDENGMLGKAGAGLTTAKWTTVGVLSDDAGTAFGTMFAGTLDSVREVMSSDEPPSKSGGDSMKPDMSKYPPIQGVDFHLWVSVEVGLVKGRVAPTGYDQYAQSMGVPAGQWGEIDRAWNQRMMSDWKLGALKGSEYEKLMKAK